MILVWLFLSFSSCNPSTLESQVSCIVYICDDILVVDLVTLVVDIFVDIVAYLVDNGLDGVIVVIGTSVAVVT